MARAKGAHGHRTGAQADVASRKPATAREARTLPVPFLPSIVVQARMLNCHASLPRREALLVHPATGSLRRPQHRTGTVERSGRDRQASKTTSHQCSMRRSSSMPRGSTNEGYWHYPSPGGVSGPCFLDGLWCRISIPKPVVPVRSLFNVGEGFRDGCLLFDGDARLEAALSTTATTHRATRKSEGRRGIALVYRSLANLTSNPIH